MLTPECAKIKIKLEILKQSGQENLHNIVAITFHLTEAKSNKVSN
jgi:hypothetical protein